MHGRSGANQSRTLRGSPTSLSPGACSVAVNQRFVPNPRPDGRWCSRRDVNRGSGSSGFRSNHLAFEFFRQQTFSLSTRNELPRENPPSPPLRRGLGRGGHPSSSASWHSGSSKLKWDRGQTSALHGTENDSSEAGGANFGDWLMNRSGF